MNASKRILYLCALALFFFSCEKDNSLDEFGLPKPTQEGKNIFACLVDGKKWETCIPDNDKWIPGGLPELLA
jgi:hypothetical protein